MCELQMNVSTDGHRIESKDIVTSRVLTILYSTSTISTFAANQTTTTTTNIHIFIYMLFKYAMNDGN